jgi:IclR family transcriptional regulator, acetate operon repressor
LSDISGEMVTLGTMSGIQYIHLHEIQSKHDLRVNEEGRSIRPLFMGATTKVLLSQLDDRGLKIAIKNINITPVSANTVTDKGTLLAQVKEIKKRGYDISYGEAVVGAICLSAPIRGYPLPAALSIVGPESRLKPDATPILTELLASTDRISKNMADIFQTKEG